MKKFLIIENKKIEIQYTPLINDIITINNQGGINKYIVVSREFFNSFELRPNQSPTQFHYLYDEKVELLIKVSLL